MYKRMVYLGLLLCLLNADEGVAEVFRVPDDYPTIQLAIDASVDKDVIYVSPGTYVENIRFYGKAVHLVSMCGPLRTVIAGGSFGSVITFADGEGPHSIVDGFTITNGESVNGGGIICVGADPTIRNNWIIDNRASDNGGGLYFSNASPTIHNNLIVWNKAVYGGGGICCETASPIITFCTFADNSGGQNGGALSQHGLSYPVVMNSILWGNDAPTGSQIYESNGIADVTFCDVEGGWPGTGNIDADPEFTNGPRGDYYLSQVVAGQSLDSPCVNMGSDEASLLGMDEYHTRTDGGHDMGYADLGYHYGWILTVPVPYGTIQEAIDDSLDGDTILVGAGVYEENIDFLGKRIDVVSRMGPERTVIAGHNPSNPDFGSVVTIDACTGATLRGFTLTGGTGNHVLSPQVGNSGGGIYINESSDVTIQDMIINYCHVTMDGGGLYAMKVNDLTLINVVIQDCTADDDDGGALCVYHSSFFMVNGTFTENTADYGGAMMLVASDAMVWNSIFWRNEAWSKGDEIYLSSFVGNSTLEINYSDVQGGLPLIHVDPGSTVYWGPGMIDMDPLFIDEYHLSRVSPCIDVGSNSAPQLPESDVDGDLRIVIGLAPSGGRMTCPLGAPPPPAGVVDMGADEYCTFKRQGFMPK